MPDKEDPKKPSEPKKPITITPHDRNPFDGIPNVKIIIQKEPPPSGGKTIKGKG